MVVDKKEINFDIAKLADYIKKAVKRNDWCVSFSFHNKKGTIDIVKHLDVLGVDIGIQIENNQYRYFMNIPNVSADTREKIASKLFCNGYWFNYTQDTKRNKLYKDFCGYNPDFIYRYFTLEKHYGVNSLKDISYEDIVVRRIEKDINNLEENQHEIIRIIEENL